MTNARHNLPPPADATRNITGLWRDATDPAGDRGEYVDALFRVSYEEGSTFHDLGHGRFRETPYTFDVHHLIGASVEDRDDTRFIDRDDCIRILGADTVRWIEERADADAAE